MYTVRLKEGSISKLSYDDPKNGVYNEPFVYNTDEVLWKEGFRPGDWLTFGFAETLTELPKNAWTLAILIENQAHKPYSSGRYYQVGDDIIWLCKHLFDYCDKAPKYVYITKEKL